MNREELLELQSRRVKQITVDGSDIHIRKLSAMDVDTLIREYQGVKAGAGVRFVVCRGVCDETGSRTFQDKDVDGLLKDFNHDWIAAAADEIAAFSGILKREDAAKNV